MEHRNFKKQEETEKRERNRAMMRGRGRAARMRGQKRKRDEEMRVREEQYNKQDHRNQEYYQGENQQGLRIKGEGARRAERWW